MHTLDLVFADNRVLQRPACLDDEDGVGITALGLPRAGNAAAVRLHAAVEGAGDGLGLAELDGALGGGDGERGALVEVEGRGLDGGGAGGHGGHEGGDGGCDGESHFRGGGFGWIVGWLEVEKWRFLESMFKEWKM
mgnify:CR=1 FL=1